MLIDLADFALQEQAEDKLMVAISRPWYNGSYTMAAKPFKTLELHYTIIQFLINKVILSFDMIECNSPFKIGQMKMRNGWWHTPTLYKFLRSTFPGNGRPWTFLPRPQAFFLSWNAVRGEFWDCSSLPPGYEESREDSHKNFEFVT